jgi:hypothetical protein
MIDIVCFKWNKLTDDYLLSNRVNYTSDHVNILYNSIKRNTTVPFRFSCITDDKNGLDAEIRIIPLWDRCRDLGGCFNRLYMFSKDMEDIIGNRFLSIDLDCVIVGNIDNLLKKTDDFCINQFVPQKKKRNQNQLYNGGLILMNAGAREEVWTKFNPKTSPKELYTIIKENNYIGSDQAWIRHVLGKEESTFNTDDGVYSYNADIKNKELPSDAKMIFFSGKPDPSILEEPWIEQHWK